MGIYYLRKRENLDLILRTIGRHPTKVPIPEDGSFEGKPALLWLESTARCNLRCAKCGHAIDPPGTPRILPRNLPDAVVDEADEYFGAAIKVRTSGYGEMFLYSRLKTLVERIKHFECWTEGTTNGVVIDRSEVDWLVDLGYDQLVFSIDGVKPETMQRLRGADINKIWDILAYIKERKQQARSSVPKIVVGFVAQSDNLHELPDLVRKLTQYDVCFLAVNTLHYGKYIPGWDDPYGELYRDFSIGNLNRRRVETLLEEGRDLAEQAHIRYETYLDLDEIYRKTDEDADEAAWRKAELITISPAVKALVQPAGQAPPEPPLLPQGPLEPYYCVYPWLSLFVAARGTASICCSLQGDIGTVLNSGDLDRVWHGEALNSIRRAVAKGEVHSQCAYCVSQGMYKNNLLDLESAKEVLVLQDAPEKLERKVPEKGKKGNPIIGYFDTTPLTGRRREQVPVAGWVGSKHGAPIRTLKLRLKLNGKELGSIKGFHMRSDVAAHYGREDLLYSGWQTILPIPDLKPGDYEVVSEVIAADGSTGSFGSVVMHITA